MPREGFVERFVPEGEKFLRGTSRGLIGIARRTVRAQRDGRSDERIEAEGAFSALDLIWTLCQGPVWTVWERSAM